MQAIGIGHFFGLDAGTAGAGAAIRLPIFESGRLKAGLAGATAALDVAIANYNDGVIRGVGDAADAIARIHAIDAERVRSAEIVRGYGQTGRLNKIRVATGLDSRLDLVDNDIRLLDAPARRRQFPHRCGHRPRTARAGARRRLRSCIGRSMTDIRDIEAPASPGAVVQPRESVPPPTTAKPAARRRWLAILAVFIVIGLIVWAVAHFLLATPEEETDDAYVAGDVVAVTARDPGQVIAIHADNTQAVKAGDPLIDLDPATVDVNTASAAADLAKAVRSTRADFSKATQGGASVEQAKAELSRAKDDLRRRRGAAVEGAVSGEELAHAEDAVKVAVANLNVANSEQAQSQSTVAGTSVDSNPAVLAAIAMYRRAAIAQGHMHVVAPIDGIVAQRTVQLGQQVAAGTPMMAVVPLMRVWVDANFRETQLKDLRIGQPASVVADMYGSGIVYHGHVIGLGAGSGNAFALLPPQNASGNWIKIVQRVPVRIALDPRELQANPLRVGLSVKTIVATSDVSGAADRQAGRAGLRRQGDGCERSRRSRRASARSSRRTGDGAGLMATAPQAQKPPLKGSALALIAFALGARHVYDGARHHDRERLIADDCGQPRRLQR